MKINEGPITMEKKITRIVGIGLILAGGLISIITIIVHNGLTAIIMITIGGGMMVLGSILYALYRGLLREDIGAVSLG